MGVVRCVDERSYPLPLIVTVLALFLQMVACVGALVLLFAAQAVITVWNGCAWQTSCVRSLLTPAGRSVFTSMCSWGRAVQVLYLGTAASWTASQAARTFTPERAPASPTPILEHRRFRPLKVLPIRLLVPSGLPSATEQAGRASGIGA